jgi:hypothetical protein
MKLKDVATVLGIIVAIIVISTFIAGIFPVQMHTIPEPVHSITPTPGPTPPPFGVPHTGGPWRVTIDDAYKETEVTTAMLDKVVYTSQSGYIFLVVNASFHYLGPTPMNISAMDVTVISEDGEILDFYACGMPEIWFVGSKIRFQSWEHNHVRFILVFVLREDDIDQVFTLKFQEVPPIPFSVRGWFEKGLRKG